MEFRDLRHQHQDQVAALDAWIEEEEREAANPRGAARRRTLMARRDPFDYDDKVFYRLFRCVLRV